MKTLLVLTVSLFAALAGCRGESQTDRLRREANEQVYRETYNQYRSYGDYTATVMAESAVNDPGKFNNYKGTLSCRESVFDPKLAKFVSNTYPEQIETHRQSEATIARLLEELHVKPKHNKEANP